ncbi:hypothetical protein [Pilibacter termitis]|nr:hypothetical protein [Pilibacter termitis]
MLIAAVLGVVSAVGIMLNVNKLREGLDTGDDRTTTRAITGIVINGVMAVAATGLGAHAIGLLGKIQF